MATILEHAIKLADTFPNGGPVYLSKMAEIFWPDADWLNYRVNRHNGGARRGARCAGALAGRLERAGYLWMTMDFPRNYQVKVDEIRKAQHQTVSNDTRGQASEAAASALENALSSFDEVEASLSEAVA